ncbi:hypothetical protein [Falsiphaeobacter marinintestinus]|uniref:hypothetical protein n=1 Tax=Falsiphaeobacter marinintestinus TaxID=1492905 RepID=UPI0011B7E045|nr:hypothetical protein [Phaeobacter marinintestinus]
MIRSFSVSAFIVFGFCLWVSAIAASDQDVDYIHTTCEPSASCPIEYDHLATQDTDPFVLSPFPRERKAELRQVERFKTVTDCLVRMERHSETPDLRKIDWKKMTSKAAFASLYVPGFRQLWIA